MIGVELDRPCGDLVGQALEAGLLINVTMDKVIRAAAAARDERRRSPPCAFHPRSAGALVPRAARPRDARARMKKGRARLRHYCSSRTSRAGSTSTCSRARAWIKDKFKRYERYWPLEDRTLAMIFEKPSTRTRPLVRGGNAPARGAAIYLFTRDFAAWAGGAGRGRRAGDFADVRFW